MEIPVYIVYHLIFNSFIDVVILYQKIIQFQNQFYNTDYKKLYVSMIWKKNEIDK